MYKYVVSKRMNCCHSGRFHAAVLFAITILAGQVALRGQISQPPLPAINTNNVITITNLTGWGNDGIITNTATIQSAISMAASGGTVNGLSGGTVRIPGPGIYLCGPLTLANNVDLHIEANATLLALPLAKYPGGTVSPANFIQGSNGHDMEISGSGVIEGQGSNWWTAYNADNTVNRPNLVNYSACTRILVQDISISNSPSPHLVIKGKAGSVTVKNVTIQSLDESPNTDAFDLAETNAWIQDCHFSEGDDNLALGSSASVTCDILVTNCYFRDGHGCSIGSFTSGGVSNLWVINCGFSNTDNGIRIKSERTHGGMTQNLNYRNLQMTNVAWPICLYSYYEFGLGTITGVTPLFASTNMGTSTANPKWQNITFTNITASSPNGRQALMIWGMSEYPATNIIFDHMTITSTTTKLSCIYNAAAVQFIDCVFNYSAAASTFTLYNADVTFTNRTFAPGLIKLDGLSTNLLATNLFSNNTVVNNHFSNRLKFYNGTGSFKTTNVVDAVPLTVSDGTLTVSNNFNLAELTPLNLVLGTNASEVVVKGNLTMNGALGIIAGGGFTNGTYTLATYAGSLSGGLPTLNTPLPSGYDYALDTSTPGQLNLDVSLSVVPLATNAFSIVMLETNNQLQLSWPSDHTGWTLQIQTNSLDTGIGTNWTRLTNSVSTNQLAIPITQTNGAVFLRMVYP